MPQVLEWPQTTKYGVFLFNTTNLNRKILHVIKKYFEGGTEFFIEKDV